MIALVYAWSKKGRSYIISTCGSTEPHPEPYVTSFEDDWGNTSFKELPRPKLAHFLYDYLPLIDDVLDAQKTHKPIVLFSSAGVTVVQAPKNILRRALNWMRLTWRYSQLDAMRSKALKGKDPQQRGQFLESIESNYKTKIQFETES